VYARRVLGGWARVCVHCVQCVVSLVLMVANDDRAGWDIFIRQGKDFLFLVPEDLRTQSIFGAPAKPSETEYRDIQSAKNGGRTCCIVSISFASVLSLSQSHSHIPIYRNLFLGYAGISIIR
jgi:hypothetical protein